MGIILWTTLMQTYVPGRMLGRVSALDWLVSLGLTPLSFALTGPVSGAIGVTPTLVGGGALAAAVSLLALFLPGVRDLERAHPG